ncbi:hypothetical protein EMPG_13010 [Blastomyces silverae]|uniref:Uncharacterized protein n=1 Tax=Blastomyces silverae TaxID=2060906 RepID=A0A0H1BK16_9EURO|nr:hypothetical protein EMPG_13010 [Blastomyces silverae]
MGSRRRWMKRGRRGFCKMRIWRLWLIWAGERRGRKGLVGRKACIGSAILVMSM